MVKKGTFSSNFLVLFSGNTIAQIVPFLFAPLITRLFVEEDIAVQKHFLALAAMISIVAAGRYEMAIVLPAEKRLAMNLYSLSMRLIVMVTLGSILFFIFSDQLDHFYAPASIGKYSLLLLAAIPLYAITNVFSNWLLREKKFKAYTSSGIVRSALINVFTILFGYSAMGALGLILGTLLGFAVALLLMYLSARSTLDHSLVNADGRREVSKSFKDFPVTNAPHAFVDHLFSQFILFWIISHEFGLVELTYYSMMAQLLLASMRAIGGAVGQLYYKEASDLKESGGNVTHVLFRSVKLVSFFAVPAFVGIILFGPQLFAWYLGPGYVRAGEYAQVMIFPFFLNFIVSPISCTPIIYRKQQQAFAFSLAGYITSVGAFMIGNYMGYTFKESLVLFAIFQGIYYCTLFIWYIYLTKKKHENSF